VTLREIHASLPEDSLVMWDRDVADRLIEPIDEKLTIISWYDPITIHLYSPRLENGYRLCQKVTWILQKSRWLVCTWRRI
jgi:hypothetical protein